MNENNGTQILGIAISAWAYAPILFVLWLAGLYFAKGILFRTLRKWSEKSGHRTGEFLIQSLRLPLNFLILGGGLALLERLLPLPREFDQPMTLAVKAAVIIALFLFFDRLVVRLLSHFASKVHAIDLDRGIAQGIVRLVILSLGFLILLDAMGISITPLIASLGIGSLAVALGLQDTLANLFAGLFILADQPIRTGDFIKLESGEEGFVKEIGWRNTRILMLSDILVVVPNHKVISSAIHNYYLPDREIAAPVDVTVHYFSDLARVEQVTVEVARQIQKEVKGAVANFDPFIRYHTFSDTGVKFTVLFRVREFTDQYLVKHEFIKALNDRYQKEGIIIPFPIRAIDSPARILEEMAASLQKRV